MYNLRTYYDEMLRIAESRMDTSPSDSLTEPYMSFLLNRAQVHLQSLINRKTATTDSLVASQHEYNLPADLVGSRIAQIECKDSSGDWIVPPLLRLTEASARERYDVGGTTAPSTGEQEFP